MLHNICLQFDWSIKEQQNQDKIVRNQESGQNCLKPKKKGKWTKLSNNDEIVKF